MIVGFYDNVLEMPVLSYVLKQEKWSINIFLF
jgi:hypothetical protein